MKDKPIIFSTPMVQAILEGRKTQTRRIVTESVVDKYYEYDDWCNAVMPSDVPCTRTYEREYYLERARYKVGDILYVREAYYPKYFDDGSTAYKADYNKERIGDVVPEPKWNNPMYMPEATARIFLRVTDVRVERLQAIRGKDIMHEGINEHWWNGEPERWETEQRLAYKKLWDTLNAKRGYGWDKNPWVWVIEFERIGSK